MKPIFYRRDLVGENMSNGTKSDDDVSIQTMLTMAYLMIRPHMLHNIRKTKRSRRQIIENIAFLFKNIAY